MKIPIVLLFLSCVGVVLADPPVTQNPPVTANATTGALVAPSNFFSGNASAIRTGAGLVIGTNVQAYDAALTALAAGSDFVQFTGPSSTIKAYTLPNSSATLWFDGYQGVSASSGTLSVVGGGQTLSLTGDIISTTGGTLYIPHRLSIGASAPSAEIAEFFGGAADSKIVVEATGSNAAGFRLKNGTRSWIIQNYAADDTLRYVDETAGRVPFAIDNAGYVYNYGLRISGNDTSNTIYQSAGNIGISTEAGNSVSLGDTGTVGLKVQSGVVKIPSGSNRHAGTFTLTAGAATVSNTSVTANSVIIPKVKTVGGTRAGDPDIVLNAGVGFTATGGGSDTSTYNYVIFEVD